jgi:hypothetical protein
MHTERSSVEWIVRFVRFHLVQEPAGDLQPGTWRTHPVATGIVPDPCNMSLRTGLHMTAEKRGAASKDRLDRTTHISRERMMTFVRLIALLQNAL